MVQNIEQPGRNIIIKRNDRQKRSNQEKQEFDYNNILNEPIELLSESIEKQLQNEMFWNQVPQDFEQIMMNSTVDNITKSIELTTTPASIANDTNLTTTSTALSLELSTTSIIEVKTETTVPIIKTTITPLFITTSVQTTTTTAIQPTLQSTTVQISFPSTEIVSNQTFEAVNQTTTTIEPNTVKPTLLNKILTKTIDKKKSSDQSEFDWTSIMNNDSEKTIYETFYELLDNDFVNKTKSKSDQ